MYTSSLLPNLTLAGTRILGDKMLSGGVVLCAIAMHAVGGVSHMRLGKYAL
jgi:uncharacterized Zn-binding protein involved in type VI secretion